MNESNLKHTVHYGQLVFLALLICILWVLCFIGNMLVCIVIYKSRRVQSTTNYFIVGLAGTDLLFAVAVLPWITVGLVAEEWPFGDIMCRTVRFLQHFSVGVSAFVLTSICIDRFYTIIYPLTFKITRGTSKRMIAVACFVSLIFSSFAIYFYEEISLTKDNITYTVCPIYVESMSSQWTGLWFVLSLLLIQYLCPMIIIIVLYAKVFKFIWHPIGVCLQFQRTTNSVPRTKVKMVRMLMITSLASFILITPIHLLHVTSGALYPVFIDPFWYYACVVLQFSSSVVKPAIYMCYNSNFRRGCREVFCMSNMQCYRQEAYAITNVSSLGRRNHIGVMNCTSHNNSDSPSRTFDRALRDEKSSWPLTERVHSTSI